MDISQTPAPAPLYQIEYIMHRDIICAIVRHIFLPHDLYNFSLAIGCHPVFTSRTSDGSYGITHYTSDPSRKNHSESLDLWHYFASCHLSTTSHDIPTILECDTFPPKIISQNMLRYMLATLYKIKDPFDHRKISQIREPQWQRGLLKRICTHNLDLLFSTLIDQFDISYINEELHELCCLMSSFSKEGRKGFGCITDAAKKGNTAILRALLDAGVKLGSYNHLLNSASNCGHTDTVKFLLHRGWEVDAQDESLQTALFSATPDTAQVLVDHGANVNIRDMKGRTPLIFISKKYLHYQSDEDSTQIAQLLIQRGADVNAEDSQGLTALTGAQLRKKEKLIELLLKHGAKKTNPPPEPQNDAVKKASDCRARNKIVACNTKALFEAIRNEDLETIKELLSKGVSPNCRTDHGATPLSLTIQTIRPDIARVLLDNGADPFAKINNKLPLEVAVQNALPDFYKLLLERFSDPYDLPLELCNHLLFVASKNRCYKMVKILICVFGTDPNISDDKGKTPLHYAVKPDSLYASDYQNLKCCNLLIVCGANINAQANDGNTPMHTAAILGSTPIIKLFVDHGADIEALNNEQQTPLHYATRYRSERVEALVEEAANTEARDRQGRTPFHYAVIHCPSCAMEEIVKNYHKKITILIDAETNIDAQDECGKTPLHYAVIYRQPQAVKLLIKRGANIFLKDDKGRTALDLAKAKQTQEIIQTLEKAETNQIRVGVKRKGEPLQLSGKRSKHR